MTSEFFSQSIHILSNIFWERRNSSARKIVPWKTHRKNVNFGPILNKFIFLKWKSKTGLNGPLKCPKFEKQLECKRTANFNFCPSHLSHNLGQKTRRKEKCWISDIEINFLLAFLCFDRLKDFSMYVCINLPWYYQIFS